MAGVGGLLYPTYSIGLYYIETMLSSPGLYTFLLTPSPMTLVYNLDLRLRWLEGRDTVHLIRPLGLVWGA